MCANERFFSDFFSFSFHEEEVVFFVFAHRRIASLMANLHSNVATMSETLSGTRYASHVAKAGNRSAWMDIAVFEKMPAVPSKSATAIYKSGGNLASLEDTTSSLRGQSPVAAFRVSFELWPSESPNAVQNFVNLCNETSLLRAPVVYEREEIPLSYRGTFFHKIIPGFIVQGGDLTRVVHGGANHISSFGKVFDDENKRRPFDQAGLLAMANNGPNTNGSQFFITLGDGKDQNALNARHCCFGKCVSGLEELQQHVGPYGNDRGEALRFVVVTGCGAE